MERKKIRSKKINEKEVQLIKLIAEGWIDTEIGEQIGISNATIRYRLDKLYLKTETFNRPSLVYWACKNNVI